MTITQSLFHHHKHCDEAFAAAEAAVDEGRWHEAGEAFQRMREELETHFGAEEELLFPAFERQTGMQGGPTQVMRLEHGQMRELVARMAEALERRAAKAFAGEAETLLILMQQHNMKEENILYPMCDRAVEPAVGSAIARRLSGAPCPA